MYKTEEEKIEARKRSRIKYESKNKDKVNEMKKNYREKNKDIINKNKRITRRTETGKFILYLRNIKRKYDINYLEYCERLIKQDYTCPICSKKYKEDGHRFVIDHCHNTGKIRGLLCRPCNTGIGNLKDSESILRNAIIYLEESYE